MTAALAAMHIDAPEDYSPARGPPPCICGTLTLEPGNRTLTGQRGAIRLSAALFAIAERLMQRPGTLVSTSDLITAMYGRNDEADSAEVILRGRIKMLRACAAALSGGRVRIVNEVSVGYLIEPVPW